MLAQYLCLVLLLPPFLTIGLMLIDDNVELIHSLAADLGCTCITVIVEDVDKINIKVRKNLNKQDFAKLSPSFSFS